MTHAEMSTVPTDADLVISGADIVCLDANNTIWRDAALAVTGNVIVWIGPANAARGIKAGTFLNGSGQVVIPGLIDGHFHTAQQLLRGKIAALGRLGPIKSPVWRKYYIPFESMLGPEDIYLSALVAYTDMLSVGTTCFAEAGGPYPDEMARAAEEVGIRGFVALSTVDQGNDLPDTMRLGTDEALQRNVDLVERRRNHPLVRAMLAMRQITICSPPLIAGLADAARRTGARIHTHLAEGTYEVDYTIDKFGMRPAEWLHSIGALDHHWHCAHSVLLSGAEVDLFAANNASACHCAFNNYHIGKPRLHEMWRRGIRIGLGTDGAAAWGPLDIFQVAHAARIGHQAVAGTPFHHHRALESEELLRIATNGGARALGIEDEVGSLEVGKKADFLAVTVGELDQMPVYDPLFAVAFTATGRDVRTAVVNGRVVMRDRVIQTVDTERLAALLRRRLPDLMDRFSQLVG